MGLKDGPSVMMKVSIRSACTACALTVLLLVSGCHRHRKSKSAPNTDAYSDNLHQLVEKKAMPPEKVDTTKAPNLRWPNFSDYEPYVATFYDDRNYEVAWTRDGAPTATEDESGDSPRYLLSKPHSLRLLQGFGVRLNDRSIRIGVLNVTASRESFRSQLLDLVAGVNRPRA